MGIFETLAGLRKVLSYEIVFAPNTEIRPFVPEIPGPDLIRLWACYEAKIVYNLGFPDNVSATMALGSVAKVVEKDIDRATDCFRRAGFVDVVQFAPQTPVRGTAFTGEFYAKGGLGRSIKTNFPRQISEQQVVFSGLALMQYAIIANRTDADALRVLTETARNLVALYESGKGQGVAATVEIPTLAYMRAIGAA